MKSLPIVDPDDTLSFALRVMELDGDRTVLIADKSGKLLGILTEGDIAKKAGNLLHDRVMVRELMNANPRYLPDFPDAYQVLHLFVQTGSLVFPIISSDSKIVGVARARESLKEILSSTI